MTFDPSARASFAAAGLVALGAALAGKSWGTALGAGAAAGAVTWAVVQHSREPRISARENASKHAIEYGYGSLKPPVLRLLGNVNSSELFATRTRDGWVFGEVPTNEYEVRQLP